MNTKLPANLDEALIQLEQVLNEEDLNYIRSSTTEDAMNIFHFSLGMSIRNNWRLWKDGALKNWFNIIGIQHADDMSGIILTSFWRKLHNKPIDVDSQVKAYQGYWAAQETD
jgi:hypothetical protein